MALGRITTSRTYIHSQLTFKKSQARTTTTTLAAITSSRFDELSICAASKTSIDNVTTHTMLGLERVRVRKEARISIEVRTELSVEV